MDIRSLRGGAVAGMLGGAMMAMFSMVALAATGKGFWTPVNLIAHTVWDEAPLDGAFSGGGLVVGIAVHMAVSMMLGVATVLVAGRVGRAAPGALAVGLGIAGMAWVGQRIVWPAIDEAAASAFTDWVLLVGHVPFGMVAGLGAYAVYCHSGSCETDALEADGHTG